MENVVTGKQLTVESKFNGSQLTRNQAAAQSNFFPAGSPDLTLLSRSLANRVCGINKSTGRLGVNCRKTENVSPTKL